MGLNCPNCGVPLKLDRDPLLDGRTQIPASTLSPITPSSLSAAGRREREKPVIRTAMSRNTGRTFVAGVSVAPTPAIASPIVFSPATPAPAEPAPPSTPTPAIPVIAAPRALHTHINAIGLPNPLPTLPDELDAAAEEEFGPTLAARVMPFALGFMGLLGAASVFYLYSQGSSLWQRARQAARATSHALAPAKASSGRQTLAGFPNAKPAAVTLARNEGSPTIPAEAKPNIPLTKPLPPLASPADSDDAEEADEPPARTNPMLVRQNAPATLIDQVKQIATAPARAFPILVRFDRAKIHADPSAQSPVVATAAIDSKLDVVEWNDQWFKVMKQGALLGWLRNDLAQVMLGGEAGHPLESSPALVEAPRAAPPTAPLNIPGVQVPFDQLPVVR